ncbi:MAG: GatB/YqeY domain-containing protein, partial [Propionicimonas sp.]|nr:GatB/YqeY domain-containing protein [Propionicimonas sp.]
MAELKDRLRTDRVAAMKARDEIAKNTLGMALTAIQLEEVAGDVARELSDDEVRTVLVREVAKRKDSAQAYTD